MKVDKMKICIISNTHLFIKVGGAELQTYLISNFLRTKGYEVYYIFNSNINQKFPDDGIIYFKIKNYEGNQYNFLNYFKLKRILKNISPDIVFQRSVNSYSGFLSFLKNKLNYIYIISLSSDINSIKHNKYKNNKVKTLINIPNNILSNYGLLKADEIIVQSKYQKENILKIFHRNSSIIYNGLSIEKNEKSDKSDFTILWVGNIKPLKQPEIFIRIANYFKNYQIKFIMIGELKEDKYSNHIRILLKNSNVEFLGKKSLKETNKYFKKSSIYINTSKYEGFPNTYIQSWLNEAIVISLNVDPDNILEKNHIGFKINNEIEIKYLILKLYQNQNILNKIGKRAYKYAESNHNINKNLNKLVEIIEKYSEESY